MVNNLLIFIGFVLGVLTYIGVAAINSHKPSSQSISQTEIVTIQAFACSGELIETFHDVREVRFRREQVEFRTSDGGTVWVQTPFIVRLEMEETKYE